MSTWPLGDVVLREHHPHPGPHEVYHFHPRRIEVQLCVNCWTGHPCRRQDRTDQIETQHELDEWNFAITDKDVEENPYPPPTPFRKKATSAQKHSEEIQGNPSHTRWRPAFPRSQTEHSAHARQTNAAMSRISRNSILISVCGFSCGERHVLRVHRQHMHVHTHVRCASCR